MISQCLSSAGLWGRGGHATPWTGAVKYLLSVVRSSSFNISQPRSGLVWTSVPSHLVTSVTRHIQRWSTCEHIPPAVWMERSIVHNSHRPWNDKKKTASAEVDYRLLSLSFGSRRIRRNISNLVETLWVTNSRCLFTPNETQRFLRS